MEKVSLCIPTYNSSSFILKSFINVLDNDKIDDIIINDDCSDDFPILKELIDSLGNPKIRLFKNEINLKAYKNKYETVKKAKNNWVVLLDSDNIINNDYIEKLYTEKWNNKTIYCPEFAVSNFTYSHILSLGEITIQNCRYTNIFQFDTFLNTGNYFLNKQEYVEKFESSDFDPIETLGLDVFYYNTNWLIQGNGLKIIPGLKYIHTIRNDGFYTKNVSTASFSNQKIIDRLLQYAV